MGGPPQAGVARSAGYIIPVRPAGLPDGGEVHQRAARGQRHRPPRHGGLHRRRKEVPGRVVRRVHRAGIPSARARHVRAAGSSQRDPVSWRARRRRPTTTPAGRSRFRWECKFDRILEPFTGPFERVAAWNVRPPQGRVGTLADATGYTLSRATNDAFRAVNRLMALGEQVSAVRRRLSAGTHARPRLRDCRKWPRSSVSASNP